MGCDETNCIKEIDNNFFLAYKSYKEMIIYIKVNEDCTRNVFLISVNSFPEFFKIIKNSKVLDNFGNTSLEENLEKDLKNY